MPKVRGVTRQAAQAVCVASKDTMKRNSPWYTREPDALSREQGGVEEQSGEEAKYKGGVVLETTPGCDKGRCERPRRSLPCAGRWQCTLRAHLGQ